MLYAVSAEGIAIPSAASIQDLDALHPVNRFARSKAIREGVSTRK
jgi:hypothetical protein